MTSRSDEDALISLIYHERYEEVEEILKRKINVNFWHRESRSTPLIEAISRGDYKMVKLLLENGADCNGVKEQTDLDNSMNYTYENELFQETPLINAAIHGYSNILKILLLHGADTSMKDIRGRSALNVALQKGHQKCAEILILSGSEVTSVDFCIAAVLCPAIDLQKLLNDKKKIRKTDTKKQNVPTVHSAALAGDYKALITFIRKGADVNSVDNSGKSALHFAVQKCYITCAELLIKEGADVNIQDNDKVTALHIAASHGISQIIPSLVERGAIVDARDSDETTPLHCAVFHSFPVCVKELLKHGANVNAIFAGGKTALHIAVSKSTNCIELLMEENANIFAKDNMGICPLELASELCLDTFRKLLPRNYNTANAEGVTPLHVAAQCHKTECLKLMIKEGCDVNVVTNSGDTPLHFACRQGTIANNLLHLLPDSEDPINIELLVNAGVDINKPNNTGLSPIHVCAKNGSFTPLRILCDFGADLNLLGGEKNQTPLHYAAEAGNVLCIKYLIEKGADKNAVNVDNCTSLFLAARNIHFICVRFLLENDAPFFPQFLS